MDEALIARLDTLPTLPGCYLFLDKKGKIIYVGKARSLRQRVRQYFAANSSDYRYFVPLLEKVLGDVETIVTATEKEAVLLESSLIKEHKPKYNVKLRDDKSYLSLRVDRKKEWPLVEMVRRPTADGAHYFGPYPNASSARRALKLVNRHFKLRTCSDSMMASRTRPCLEYQIKRCPGPCVYEVDHDAYVQQIKYAELFLEGKNDELSARIETGMKEAAKELNFERAATLRDQLTSIREVHERQRVAEVSDIDRDVIGLYREGDTVAVALLVVRAGFVRDTQITLISKIELPDDEIVNTFISRRYSVGESDFASKTRIPDEIVVAVLPEMAEGLASLLTELKGTKVEILVPKAGRRSQLLAMAHQNAQHRFRERRVVEKSAEEHAEALQERLGLLKAPRTIECVDISHHQGAETVAAVVCLENGIPKKRNYRSFHIQTESSGDDYKAMLEVLTRRFKRGKNNEAGWEFPDLFMVDGGRGQLGIALAVLKELNITNLAVCSLAKERENVAGDKLVDRVYMPNQKNPINIDRHQAALVMLARARDEAHRFANKIREDLHHRRRLSSELDKLPGIGTKSRVALLKHFGSLDGVRDAAMDQLMRVEGISEPRARAVFEYFHGRKE